MSIVRELRAVPSRISESVRRHAALRPMPGPAGHPVLGHMRQLGPDHLMRQMHAWADRYGGIYRCRILHRPLLVVSEVSLVREILRQRPGKIRRLSTMESVADELGINGVFTAEGDDWRRQRRLVMSAFGRSKLADMQATIAMVTDRMLSLWERRLGERLDVYPDLTRFTADVTTLVAFGYDLDSLRTPAQLQQCVTAVFEGLSRRLFAPLPYWRVFKLPRDHAMERAVDTVRTTVQAILREDDPGGADNLLRRLQQARLAEGSRRGLSEPELFANVMAMLFAGEDTTANTLGWMFHYIATHPQAQARMRQEIDEVLGDADRVRTPEQAASLHTITAAFIEALRLRPVAPLMSMQTNELMSLGGYDVHAGTQVVVLLDRDARNPERFADTEEFMPERWRDPKVDLSRPADGLFPFGGGPRLCPGRGLAALEVQTLLGTLLRRYAIEPAPGARTPKTVVSFTFGPDRVEVVLRPRAG